MTLPNYAGQLLDKIILLVIEQTGNVKYNPDDPNYPGERSAILKRTAWELFKARNDMQQDRRDEEDRLRKKKEAEQKAAAKDDG